jgi:hypothetical protein
MDKLNEMISEKPTLSRGEVSSLLIEHGYTYRDKASCKCVMELLFCSRRKAAYILSNGLSDKSTLALFYLRLNTNKNSTLH